MQATRIFMRRHVPEPSPLTVVDCPEEGAAGMGRKRLSSLRLPSLGAVRASKEELDSLDLAHRTLGTHREKGSSLGRLGEGAKPAREDLPMAMRQNRRCKTTQPEEVLRCLPDSPEGSHAPQLMSRHGRRQKTISLGLSQLSTPSSVCDTPPVSVRSGLSVSADTDHLVPPLPEVMERAAITSWRKGTQIGSGSYGCVYRAQDCRSGYIFAVKQAAVEDGTEADRRYIDSLTAELEICRNLRHPNIVSYLGHERQDKSLYIFLEYLPGGSMASVLQEFGPLCLKLLRQATNGCVQGLSYLHTRSPPVLHRDIKAANLLVDLHFHVKLADFGCSRRAAESQTFTTVGSVPWMAPEVIMQQNGYGRKADIWSLGCTVLEMATAEKPWGNGSFNSLAAAFARIGMSKDLPNIPDTVPEAGRDFIQVCVQRDPNQRPGSDDLLRHPFVAREDKSSCRAQRPAAG